MTKIRTHYDNLKVTRNAPDIVIRAAHKALLQLHHPDKANDKVAAERITRILNDARDVLLDPVRRRQHDDWIKEQEERHHHRKSQRHSSPPPFDESQPPPETRAQDTEPVIEQPIGKYLASTDGTAIDTETRLMWCRFSLGQTWRENAVQGDAKVYIWHDALDAAQTFNRQGGYAGYTDWRIPGINELKTLLDRPVGTAGAHFINNLVFLKNPPWVWSSTPYAGYGGGSWYVNFSEGIAVNESPSFHRAVRLVRGQPAAL
ncbi:MAG: DUF1566 domain-containing protein [Methylovulum sp.]|nr:MAG: DUF1566 domain-containing protein [Methylovulum sp.]